jgi:putative aminopeptidase FrvX
VAEGGGLPRGRVRLLAAFASHEEIGRFGSRVLAAEFGPDVLVAVDGAVPHQFYRPAINCCRCLFLLPLRL